MRTKRRTKSRISKKILLNKNRKKKYNRKKIYKRSKRSMKGG